jgi:F-type H+-transporting ATPase subunit delta
MSLRLARSYAKALLAAVGSNEAGIVVRDELRRFVATTGEHPAFARAMASPTVPLAAKEKVVHEIADRLALSAITRRFIDLLLRNYRMGQLAAVLAAVEDLLNHRLGIAVAKVTTATPLGDGERRNLLATLERITGRKVELAAAVDPKLLGGFVAKIDSTLYDASLRGQLDRLAGRLAGA